MRYPLVFATVTVLLAAGYGGATLWLWARRPPFGNRFAIGEISSVFPGWRKYPEKLRHGKDGRSYLVDVVDNVIVAFPASEDAPVIGARWSGPSVVISVGDNDVKVRWTENELVLIDGGVPTYRSLEPGDARRVLVDPSAFARIAG